MNLTFLLTSLSIFCLVAGRYRLPSNVKPTFYKIKFHPNLDTETFEGHVTIHIRIESLTKSIVFHSRALNITSLFLNSQKVSYISDAFNCTLCYLFEDYDLIKIKHKDGDEIGPGSYRIDVKFTGQFSTDDTGFFKTFKQNSTTQSYIAVTNFEPTHARRTFPCFDEPAFKAKFQLTLVAPNNSYTVLSNMRAIERFNTSYGQVHKFETSPVMSPYLLAFAISQYKFKEKNCESIPIRTFSYDQLSKNVTDYICESLRFYQRYTNYCYTLPKIDFIEFDRASSTATENWGLVTVATGVLSNDLETFGNEQKVNILTHEIAHFWFGNLVTNEWWDDIWLHEGFAVFMSLKAEEHILHDHAVEEFSRQMLEELIYPSDIKNESHPIVNFAQKPSTIKDNFSDIAYTKGAALLLMLELVLGEKRLQEVIQRYIRTYAFGVASTNNFISILEDCRSDNINLREFMESYLYQNTYPIIHIEERDNNYVLRQSSCSAIEKNVESPNGYKWTIPLHYKTNKSKNNTTLVWFDKDIDTLMIPKNDQSWVMLNPEKFGLYRANYSKSIWKKFIEHAEEMNKDDKGFLYLEAAQLFNVDVISCDTALHYLKKITEKNNNMLPIDINLSLQVYPKFSKVKYYNKKAHACFKNYFINVLNNTGQYKQKSVDETESHNGFVLLDLYDDEENIAKDDEASENMKSCINWICKSFSNYCHN